MVRWRPVPVLPMRVPARTQKFYEALGFRVSDASPDDVPYLIARRNGAEVHFFVSPSVDPRTSAFGFYLEVDDVDEVHAEWVEAHEWRSPQPQLIAPEDKPWGRREMALVDPDGTLVRVAARPKG